MAEEELSSEEKEFYEDSKRYSHITGQTLVSISDEIFDENIAPTSLWLVFGVDEDYDTFNAREFLNKVCSLLNIDINDIGSVRKQRGSCIIKAEIEGKKCDVKIKFKQIYTALTDKVKAELAKLKVFFMFMGNKLQKLHDNQKFRHEIKLHPEFNRTYGPGHTYWTGSLNDGRDRGTYPYFCPVGWKRYAIDVSDNFREKFEGWSICYHGTKFEYGLSILLSGLAPAENAAHGAGIYASSSIIYVSHPRYSGIKQINSPEEKSFFNNANYVQFVLQCRVHPKNVAVIGRETLGICNRMTIDSNVSNNEIEWVVSAEKKKIMDFNDPNSTIVCTGLMIRATDNHPGLLPESQWWYNGHVCDDPKCCRLAIKLDELNRKRSDGEQCNIIYE